MNPLYIDDLVNWAIQLVEMKAPSGAYNMAGRETVSVRQLAEIIGDLTARTVHIECRPEVSGDTIGNTDQASRATGYFPEWTLSRGLAEVLRLNKE